MLVKVDANESAKALSFTRQADKKMHSWFGGSRKFEEASELFQKAGNLLKVNKSCTLVVFKNLILPGDEAGRAYCRAAECLLRAHMNYEASQQYINASHCFRKSSTPGGAFIGYLLIDLQKPSTVCVMR